MRKIIQIIDRSSHIVGLADDGTLWKRVEMIEGNFEWLRLPTDEYDLRWTKDEAN